MRGSGLLTGANLGSVGLVGDPAQAGATAPDPYSGPAMLWLLLGLSLVGGGSATVGYARRRTSPALA